MVPLSLLDSATVVAASPVPERENVGARRRQEQVNDTFSPVAPDVASPNRGLGLRRNTVIQIRPATPPPADELHGQEDVHGQGNPPPEPPGGGEDGDGVRQPRKDATWLARELTKVECFGHVSTASMEKVTRLFMDNIDDIAAIKRRGEVSSSYKHSIKKRLNIWQPAFKSAVKFVDLDNADDEPEILRDLKAIPKKYLNPTLQGHYRVLRTEAYTTLSDIKKHYEATHPTIRGEELRNAYKYAAVGIDGVREANSGSRTLYIVTIMFAGCVFLWHIYNPFKGCVGAKPTVDEVLA